jgi:hypothetical protein
MKLIIAVPIPRHGSIYGRLANWLLRLPQWIGKDHEVIAVLPEQSADHATVRNNIIRGVLEQTDADVLWFVDSDMAPFSPDLPDGGVSLMLSALERDDVDIVSGLSYRFNSEGAPVPCVTEFEGNRDRVLAEVFAKEDLGLFEAKGFSTGGACLAIKRPVLEAYAADQDPPFIYTHKRKCGKWGQTDCSEDTYFIRESQKRGFRFWVDRRLVWGHIKVGDMREELERAADLVAEMEAV